MRRIRAEIEVCGMRFVQSDKNPHRYEGQFFNLYPRDRRWAVEVEESYEEIGFGETPEEAMQAVLQTYGPVVDALRELDLEGAS